MHTGRDEAGPGRAERLLDESPFAVVGIDAALNITDWNRRAAQLFGATRADAVGRAAPELLAAPAGSPGWPGMLAAGAPCVWTMHGPAGPVAVEWTRQTIRGDGDAVVGALCHGRELSAAELAASRERLVLRAVLDSLEIVAWAIDERGDFLFHEGRGLAAWGMRPGHLVGQNMFAVYGHNETMNDVRRAIAGHAAHNVTAEGGVDLATWIRPVPPEQHPIAAAVGMSLNISDMKRGEKELRDKLELIERQQRVIRELGTPIIEVWDGVLTLPIIGLVDSVRTAEIMDNLLQSVARARARFAILDMTGVEVVDTSTASHLLGMIKAIRLLGAEGIITGIHPGIAQTIVALGVDLRSITVHASLREALKYCIARMAAKR